MAITRARARAERVLQNYLDELLADEDFLANAAEIEPSLEKTQPDTKHQPLSLPEVSATPMAMNDAVTASTKTNPSVIAPAAVKPALSSLETQLLDVKHQSALDTQLDRALQQATLPEYPLLHVNEPAANSELMPAVPDREIAAKLDTAFEDAFAGVVHESLHTLADLEPLGDGLIPVISPALEIEPLLEVEFDRHHQLQQNKIIEQAAIETIAEPMIEQQVESVVAVTTGTEKCNKIQEIDSKAEVAAEESFQCLVFQIEGMSLAVRLDALGGIHKQTSAPVKLPGQPKWYRGVYKGERGNIQVVDTKNWIMGKMPDQELAGDADKEFLLLQIADTRWGLMCDSVDGTEMIQTSAVRWRESTNSRPWLAGMLVNRMCALLDLKALSGLLDQAENSTEKERCDDTGCHD
ncbi:chemotaxis protein CheW [Pelagibaculum spongiae]|uniref:CheW-like domain-containing protein n=1 Tax=Pelagibaculum spongiae TaxID=2080658 RepID=A0A2V1GXM7_9GAMM|nr:chemotaxis protein CheW [Pelagibaculum spongiae]PVZ66686.1 hypothetical protein DC094_15565 [Pelagibaculum spongiae]